MIVMCLPINHLLVKSQDEFKAYFPHAEPNVFAAIDLNGDERIDHDEWHAFKEAHGLKHHD